MDTYENDQSPRDSSDVTESDEETQSVDLHVSYEYESDGEADLQLDLPFDGNSYMFEPVAKKRRVEDTEATTTDSQSEDQDGSTSQPSRMGNTDW